ncbi:LysR family transcriptional regulator ArgP [Propionibacterium australiense]|uniref:HTH-type transcriptional regulator LysG n=1 Tax=Propionibacterium australiense TaxID=119981 RepID=A0A383S4M3_9ACTN|nr:LysR family transcriptional regulator ArgP [Propionibacterium australiense]RLP10029.1 ArgP/LysG family DNA-binding transcriptional regulator [Propionibacterium australiense]RLP11313.1 ArgP/LysG family DNA-binding transcriptional regulator [Propionibacterium australiense]SYZ32945.1 Transcription regulator HTH, LysR [Propionibacterium australiense]VEH92379.1 Uncharacterized HTH-type transcriptional regulator Rv1985c/MT2039 [Propionibacterium australiense]
MDGDQLRALCAVVDTGTFDAAAATLHITPSAVSQRIKALERQTGQVLVQRTRPCRATEAGQVLLSAARRFAEIESDVALALDRISTAPLRVAVNADSLATWFTPVLAGAARWPDTELRLRVEDEQLTHRLLTSGEVIAAVTTATRTSPGCRSTRLGSIRYLPVASPSLWHGDPPSAEQLAALPAVCFDEKDRITDDFLAGLGNPCPARRHFVPSPQAYLSAVEAGLGWGMVPTLMTDEPLRSGRILRLHPGHVDVTLHWQCWALHTPRLERLTELVLEAARELDVPAR